LDSSELKLANILYDYNKLYFPPLLMETKFKEKPDK